MGQQQLLLIVLGFIVVGTAVMLGINMYSAAETEANREELVSALVTLSAMAQEYYQTPKMLGGGNKKFKKWKMPKFYKKFESGKIKAKVNKKGDEVKLTATGTAKGKDGKKKVKVEAKVKSTSFKIKIKN